MADQPYFTAESTSLTLPKRGCLAIYAGDKPRKNPDGSTIFALRGPMLLMPQQMWNEDRDLMDKVAAVLNANADRFFSGAEPSAETRMKALLSRALDAMSRREPDGISDADWDKIIADIKAELGVKDG